MRSLDNLRLLLADINWPEITSHVSGNNWNVLDGDWLDSWHRAVYAACDAVEAEYAELRHDLSTASGALDIAVKNETAAERELYELRGKIDSMLVDGKPMTDENMLVDGWIRLPKDADGEYIHIGDVMEGVDKYDSLKKVKGEVITVSFESDGTVDVAIQAWNSDGKSWHRAYLDPDASIYRHYHEPTVEDVLGEFFEEVGDGLHTLKAVDTQAIIAKYAAKLQLANVGE